MHSFHLIAFTHHSASLEEVGKLHIDDVRRESILHQTKKSLNIDEILYLNTCNRVEFLIYNQASSSLEVRDFVSTVYPEFSDELLDSYCNKALSLSGDEAIMHMFRVTASLDSLVVGEREIITQVRNAYEISRKETYSGDAIRLLVKKLIEGAKDVFTSTPIARNPVSVVSLAYRKLKSLHVQSNARFIIIGAGQTNQNLSRYLKKHGFQNFVIFNRTFSKAEQLAQQTNGRALPLDDLYSYSEGFDVLVTCTGSVNHIVNAELYERLNGGDTHKKITIDLAVPCDIDPSVYDKFPITPILVENLRHQAEENLKLRRNALSSCELILQKHMNEFKSMFRTRQVEIAMQEVPKKVREIRAFASSAVFAKDLDQLDPDARKVVEKMMDYMEKKYISVPMKLAREILLEHS
jgi:glutamyl-tRNA reductase